MRKTLGKLGMCGGMSVGTAWLSGQLVFIIITICVTVMMLLFGFATMLVREPDLREWTLRMRWGPPRDDDDDSDPERGDEREDGG